METLAFWTDVAVVVLGIQCFLMLIVGVALSYVLVRVTNVVHAKTEIYAAKLQEITSTVNAKTQEYSEKSIQPVVAARKQSARVGETVRSFFGRGSRRSA